MDSECDNRTEEEQRRRNDNVSFNMEYDFQTRDNKRNLTLLEPLDPISTVGAISVSKDFITVDIH